MKILLLLTSLLLFFSIVFKRKELPQTSFYITKDQSDICKVIAAITVVSCHSAIALGPSLPMSGYLAAMGYPAVGIFFFLSGYGLMKSFMAKGDIYLRNFWKNRIAKILIPFFIVSLFSFIIDCFNGIDCSQYIRNFQKGFPPLVNSWFIYLILASYFLFYCVFKIIRKVGLGISIIVIVSVLYYLLIRTINWPGHWNASILSFPFGMVLAKIDKFISFSRRVFVMTLFVISSLLLFYITHFNIPENHETLCGFLIMLILPFAIIVSVTEINIKFKRIVDLFKQFYFELYLIHGLLIYLMGNFIYKANPFLSFCLILVLSFITAWCFHKLMEPIYKKFDNK